jgi:hypothetical protein
VAVIKITKSVLQTARNANQFTHATKMITQVVNRNARRKEMLQNAPVVKDLN